MEQQPSSRIYFVYGIENRIGLKLKLYTDDVGRYTARFQPRPEHKGYPGHLHGGIISTLLYETVGRILTHHNVWTMTGRLEIELRKQRPLGEGVTLIGELTL